MSAYLQAKGLNFKGITTYCSASLHDSMLVNKLDIFYLCVHNRKKIFK
jgi:hypothetical protein